MLKQEILNALLEIKRVNAAAFANPRLCKSMLKDDLRNDDRYRAVFRWIEIALEMGAYERLENDVRDGRDFARPTLVRQLTDEGAAAELARDVIEYLAATAGLGASARTEPAAPPIVKPAQTATVPETVHIGLPAAPVVGQKYRFGTLYAGGEKQPNPTRPWDTGYQFIAGMGNGNIPLYRSGAIEIRDTDADGDYQIQWVYCGKKNERDFYIADRNILTRVSWDTLNDNGLALGKTQTLDGAWVKIGMPTGGEDGMKTTGNDWNDYIRNMRNLRNLVTPSAVEEERHAPPIAEQFLGMNNQMWNWAGCASWCRECYKGSSSYRVLRGSYASSYLFVNYPTLTGTNSGFRPVLEI